MGSERSEMPEVHAVVLNWRAPESTLRCVASLRASRGAAVDVLVVENGSGDGSAERLRERLGDESLLVLDENTGYAGGMNAGAARWREAPEPAEFLLLVTQDVVVAPDALERMTRVMRADEQIGAVGPSVYYLDDRERLMSRGFELRPHWGRIVPASESVAGPPSSGRDVAVATDVDSVDGCFLLLRREAFDAVGGLDEQFFLYFEETDLCQRIQAAGWRIAVVPSAQVWQEKHGVPGVYYFYYMTRNRFVFFHRHAQTGLLRITVTLGFETLRMFAAWIRALIVPARRAEASGHRIRLVRKVRGGLAGARDYARGRLGPMP